MEIFILGIIFIAALAAAGFAFLSWRKDSGNEKYANEISSLKDMVQSLSDKVSQLQGKMEELNKIPKTLQENMDSMRTSTNSSLTEMRSELEGKFETLKTAVTKQLGDVSGKIESAFNAFRKELTQGLDTIRQNTDTKLEQIRDGNEKKLDQMRKTVDDKLEKTLNERLGHSFKVVSDQLDLVGKGLGKMQGVSESVDGLKKALTSAPTRGAMGEVVLENLLRDTLPPAQYEKNVNIDPSTKQQVDFAIRIPEIDGTNRWLPVDSKFPLTEYEHYVDAIENSEKEVAKKHLDNLVRNVKKEAKSIGEKYVQPPHSTDIAVMFLPNEGMYSLIASRPGLTSDLHKDYRVRVVGPNNFAAMLDTIRAGLHLFAIGQHSQEVWKILGAVKMEFGKFGGLLEQSKVHLQKGMEKLDEMSGVRSRKIRKALADVEELPASGNIGLPNLTDTDAIDVDSDDSDEQDDFDEQEDPNAEVPF